MLSRGPDRWFDAMDTREVYRGAKSDYYTHCHDLPPQIGGCRVAPAGVLFKDEVDGKDGKSLFRGRLGASDTFFFACRWYLQSY